MTKETSSLRHLRGTTDAQLDKANLSQIIKREQDNLKPLDHYKKLSKDELIKVVFGFRGSNIVLRQKLIEARLEIRFLKRKYESWRKGVKVTET